MSEDRPATAAGGAVESSPMPVPPLLSDLAGWTWRLLLLALAGYLTVQLFDRLYFIVLPFVGSLLATSLALPVLRLLRSRGVPRAGAAAITFVLAGVVFGGVALFVVDRAVSQYPQLVDQISQAVTHFRHFLTVDLHVKSSSTASIGNTIDTYLSSHSSAVASGALTGIATVAEALAALALFLFMTFFLLYDGANIWEFLVRLFPGHARDRVRGAGDQAWARLAGFVRGTFIIAIIHGVVAAVILTILQVPLVAPLSLLVFIGKLLPIIGSFVFGSLAVAVTLVTRGTVPGLIVAAVLIVDNQVEAHLLQPLLVGRYVRLHPLVVAVAIAGGGVLEGIVGAILAVPFVAVVDAVVRYLASGEGDSTRQAEEQPREPPPTEDQLVPETG